MIYHSVMRAVILNLKFVTLDVNARFSWNLCSSLIVFTRNLCSSWIAKNLIVQLSFRFGWSYNVWIWPSAFRELSDLTVSVSITQLGSLRSEKLFLVQRLIKCIFKARHHSIWLQKKLFSIICSSLLLLLNRDLLNVASWVLTKLKLIFNARQWLLHKQTWWNISVGFCW